MCPGFGNSLRGCLRSGLRVHGFRLPGRVEHPAQQPDRPRDHRGAQDRRCYAARHQYQQRGFVSDEFPGGSPGTPITITATTNGAAPVLTASRQSTPKISFFNSIEYGHIDFANFDALGAGIRCQNPNTWH